MIFEETVSNHYTHGGLLYEIQDAIARLGKTTDSITIEDIAPVDEFHIGGREATDHLLGQLDFCEASHVLDVGCGLGGASRYISNKRGASVTGVDLTQEYVEVGRMLCRWVGLEDKVSLLQASALDMPFEAGCFDGAIMLHVGMNIADKAQLFSEVFRVLRPGACFAVYDIMQLTPGKLSYPVPWASEESTSKLASPAEYRNALEQAGFRVADENSRQAFALEFFRNMAARAKDAEGTPPLGLHNLMQESTPVKISNMVRNIQAGLIAPVEIIARKS